MILIFFIDIFKIKTFLVKKWRAVYNHPLRLSTNHRAMNPRLEFVHAKTGHTFKTPWLPEVECAVYLKEHIAGEMWKADPAALQLHIKSRKGVNGNREEVTAHVHIYSPEDPASTAIFSFLNRKKKLSEVVEPGAKLYYNDNKLSFGVIEGNIWMGGVADDNDGVTCCECGKSGSNYAADGCLHRFHCKCIDAAMARHMVAACPKCNTALGHTEMMRLALTMNALDGVVAMQLQPAKY